MRLLPCERLNISYDRAAYESGRKRSVEDDGIVR
mgnify:CR=1 FL=1